MAPTDLDECGGHADATYKFYHYHVTDGYTNPYTVCCRAAAAALRTMQ